MCGRFTLTADPAELRVLFSLQEAPAWPPQYNIAPTQTVAVVRAGEARRVLVPMRWGLIPGWARDATIGNRLINARAETAAGKPAFRVAFRRRRCLIPASGFYEWRRAETCRQPHYIHPRDGGLLAFAGLWETWHGPEGVVDSCTILTTQANAVVAPLHDRMPVILPPTAFDAWLAPDAQDPATLQPLLRPAPDDAVAAYPVSSHVNSPAHDDAACLVPLPREPVQIELL